MFVLAVLQSPRRGFPWWDLYDVPRELRPVQAFVIGGCVAAAVRAVIGFL